MRTVLERLDVVADDAVQRIGLLPIADARRRRSRHRRRIASAAATVVLVASGAAIAVVTGNQVRSVSVNVSHGGAPATTVTGSSTTAGPLIYPANPTDAQQVPPISIPSDPVLPSSQMLSEAVSSPEVEAGSTIARSAIKLMPFSTIASSLQTEGFSLGNLVVPSDNVYVVAMSGTLYFPILGGPNTWAIKVINPSTGATIRTFATNNPGDGAWPAFFDSFPSSKSG